jgi:hypothetical protein
VFITCEGEASATPSGIECSTEESTNALEGDVTLTEAPKADSGDEFARADRLQESHIYHL